MYRNKHKKYINQQFLGFLVLKVPEIKLTNVTFNLESFSSNSSRHFLLTFNVAFLQKCWT